MKECNQLVTSVKITKLSLPFGNRIALWNPAAIRCALAGLALGLMACASRADTTPLRFGMTPAIVHDQHRLIKEWGDYLAARIGRPVEIVSRDRYSDTLEMLGQDKLDAAWLSDYPYIIVRRKVHLLAIPVHRGKASYQGYLIVPARDKTTRSLLQLRGAVFAYADPISHTGYLIPRQELAQAGERPARFFRKTFFTWGHRNSVEAVAAGLADASFVDSYVWDCLQKISPNLTAQTRIVSRSTEYAFPPIVTRGSMPPEEFRRLQEAMLGMSADPAGRKLLEKLDLDGFTKGRPELYDPVEKLVRALGDK